MQTFFYLFSFFVLLFQGFFRFKKELHILQLNSYFPIRYWRWTKKNFFNQLKIIELSVLLTPLFLFLNFKAIAFLLWNGIFIYSIINLATEKQKKKLVLTTRAIRLLVGMLFIFAICVSFLFFIRNSEIFWAISAILTIFPFFIIILTIFVLKPIEFFINKQYYSDAKRKLNAISDLKVIGITGSYGKTSTKFFLQKILSEKFNSLMTPESYNTTMGIIKTIRMFLKPSHQIFIAEMGARKNGDIKEICDLVHPQIAILTAVAEQHLETFKNIENVRKTKFELIDSLPQNGIAFLNFDYTEIRNSPKNPNILTYFYSIEHSAADFFAKNIRYSHKGMFFEIFKQNQKILELETKLLGNFNVSNILVSASLAYELGISAENIAFAVKNLAPVPHRMEIKTHKNGITIIDDAFNSNPNGAKMALEVLQQIQGGKKIVVTPGMVELGEKEYFYNHQFGTQMAAICDIVVLVGQKQTQPIFDGLMEKNFSREKLFVAKNLNEATKILQPLLNQGDIILYENDLPDTYKE